MAKMWPKVPVRWFILILVFGQSFYLLFTSLDQFAVEGEGRNIHTVNELKKPTQFLAEQVNSGDTIAVTRAGINAYVLPLDVRVVDMIGLTDDHIAHQTSQFPNGLFGKGDVFGKWDVNYVLDQKPIIVETMGAKQSEDGEWSTIFTGTTLLLNDPRFRTQYVYQADGFFVRADEP
jgi:hypothetical protein